MSPVIVITARAGSVRLPGKNMLPLAGLPLAAWSVLAGLRTGLPVVISTDIPELLEYARARGCYAVSRPLELATADCSHRGAIEHALASAGFSDRPCVLLQPTSPFRSEDLIARCLAAFDGNRPVVTWDGSRWDGSVAVFPAGRMCDFEHPVQVHNAWEDSAQVDTHEDFAGMLRRAAREVVSRPPLWHECAFLGSDPNLRGLRVALVARPFDRSQLGPHELVMHVNHARGRETLPGCDFLFTTTDHGPLGQTAGDSFFSAAANAGRVFVRGGAAAIPPLGRLIPHQQGKITAIDSAGVTLAGLTTGSYAAAWLASHGAEPILCGFTREAHLRAAHQRGNRHEHFASAEAHLIRQHPSIPPL